MDVNQSITTYTDIFETLKKQLRWKVSGNQLLMTIASTYLTGENTFDSERFLVIADEIKAQSKPFSIWRSPSRFGIAAVLDAHFDDAAEQIRQLFQVYDQMTAAKFHRGPFTCIAAATLLMQGKNEDIDTDVIIARAKRIYKDMKDEHILLTSSQDYPMAISLACQNKEDIIQEAEQHYQRLHLHGFRKGNDLQFLSHILALGHPYSGQSLVSNTADVFDAFKGIDLKPKPSYYPFIGMLALLPDVEQHVQMVKELYSKLRMQKHFKWQKRHEYHVGCRTGCQRSAERSINCRCQPVYHHGIRSPGTTGRYDCSCCQFGCCSTE
ncbi:DUF4003 family protein [Virgibacillus halophilus]|uniref:DUF4003 family protein n=1 Tax=Tigheibacillus halophilus TaxID=361280 RepID=A0ABU5C519_9BACI|nr:DUF4003 family protein [Virgibacillus halophilus]